MTRPAWEANQLTMELHKNNWRLILANKALGESFQLWCFMAFQSKSYLTEYLWGLNAQNTHLKTHFLFLYSDGFLPKHKKVYLKSIQPPTDRTWTCMHPVQGMFVFSMSSTFPPGQAVFSFLQLWLSRAPLCRKQRSSSSRALRQIFCHLQKCRKHTGSREGTLASHRGSPYISWVQDRTITPRCGGGHGGGSTPCRNNYSQTCSKTASVQNTHDYNRASVTVCRCCLPTCLFCPPPSPSPPLQNTSTWIVPKMAAVSVSVEVKLSYFCLEIWRLVSRVRACGKIKHRRDVGGVWSPSSGPSRNHPGAPCFDRWAPPPFHPPPLKLTAAQAEAPADIATITADGLLSSDRSTRSRQARADVLAE